MNYSGDVILVLLVVRYCLNKLLTLSLCDIHDYGWTSTMLPRLNSHFFFMKFKNPCTNKWRIVYEVRNQRDMLVGMLMDLVCQVFVWSLVYKIYFSSVTTNFMVDNVHLWVVFVKSTLKNFCAARVTLLLIFITYAYLLSITCLFRLISGVFVIWVDQGDVF